MSDEEVTIKINAKNLTKGEAESAKRDIAGIKDEAEKAKPSFESLKETIKKAFEDPMGSLKEFGTEVGEKIVSHAGAAGIAIGGIAVVATLVAIEMHHLAMETQEALVKFHDMSEITDIAVPRLVSLKYAVDIAGGSIENVTNLIFMMQKRMQENPDKFAEGLGKIGLSIKQIEDLSPDEQFLAIAKAFRENTNESNRAGVAFELFSRQGRDAIPLLMKPLEELVEKSHELGYTFSEEDAKAAEEFELQLNELKAQSKATWSTLGLHVSIAKEFSYAYERMKLAVANLTYDLVALVKIGLNPAKAAWDAFQAGDLPGAPKGPNLKGALPSPLGGTETMENRKLQALEEKKLDDEIRESIKLHKEQAKEAEKAQEAEDKRWLKLIDHSDEYSKSVEKGTEAMYKSMKVSGSSQNFFKDREQQRLANSTTGFFGYDTTKTPSIKSDNLRGFQPLLAGMKDLMTTGLPNVMMQAIAGGGNPIAAAGGMVGQHIAGNLATNLGQHLTSGLGKTIGGALGSVLPGLGTILGSVAGGLIGKGITGLGHMLGIGNTEGKQVNDMRDQFIAAAGGLDALNKKAHDAGKTLDHLLAAKKVDDFKAAVNELNGALDAQAQHEAHVNDLLEKYGIGWEEAGEKFRKQHFDTESKTLIQDFTDLVGAGVPLNTVIEHMGSNVSTFVQEALRTGTEIPAAMRPMLEQMAKSGQLLDANGDKIEDLDSSGITFSQSMTQGFQSIVNKLDELISRLTGDLPQAINAIPKDIDVTYHLNQEGDIPSFANEGFVSKPTVAMVGDAPGGEFVLHRDTVGKLMNGGTQYMAEVRNEIRGLRADMKGLGMTIARGVRDGILVAG